MKSVNHIRLAVVLLDRDHKIKAAQLAEGQPRHALRRAIEQAAQLLRFNRDIDSPRLVFLPAGSGTMPDTLNRAQLMSKCGQYIPTMGDTFSAVLDSIQSCSRFRKAKPVYASRVDL